MLNLKDVYYFVQVVDRGGFSLAGRSLRLPKSTLSHRIRELEASLGVRLINRTSRQFGVTDVGVEFYQHAIKVLQSADIAEETVRQRLAEPSGVIRVTTSVEISQFALRDLIPVFLNRYPKVRITEIATDRLVDLVGEGFDLALRGHSGPMQNSTLVQRSIASAPWYLFASPEYLEEKGTPSTPEELAQHSIISMDRSGSSIWNLQNGTGQIVTVPVEPRFLSNNMMALKEAACKNLGIAALPGYLCLCDIQNNRLRQIMPGWFAADARISILLPYRKGLLPAVRSLADFLANEMPKVTAFTPIAA